ncbi:MAG: XRE family transcriptional regulator [Firmicutes bacterium]|nr:XRE family transcriptional regulator [Bacillota bacterium]
MKRKKKTEDLINEIVSGNDISQYIESNTDEFLDTPVHIYLKKQLSAAGLKVSQVADRSCKGEYIYQVFRGIKHPGRDILICIALAMELSLEETSHLLRIARMPLLDARNRRDSILIFSLKQALPVPDTNDLLYEFDEPCL